MSGEKAKADRNPALQLITFGYNFLVFIIVRCAPPHPPPRHASPCLVLHAFAASTSLGSAYTANLAALLVAMAAPPTPLLDSISTANVKGAVVCVLQVDA